MFYSPFCETALFYKFATKLSHLIQLHETVPKKSVLQSIHFHKTVHVSQLYKDGPTGSQFGKLATRNLF